MVRSFLDTPELARRNKLLELIIASLTHYPSEQAMATILAWVPQDELEKIAPYLTGDRNILSKLPKVD